MNLPLSINVSFNNNSSMKIISHELRTPDENSHYLDGAQKRKKKISHDAQYPSPKSNKASTEINSPSWEGRMKQIANFTQTTAHICTSTSTRLIP